jgi:hypothetical protein
MNQDVDALRSRAEHAYARWRACDAEPPDASVDGCAQLKLERDVAAQALFTARRPSLSDGAR